MLPFHLELLISNAAATLATSLHRVVSRVLLDPATDKAIASTEQAMRCEIDVCLGYDRRVRNGFLLRVGASVLTSQRQGNC